MSRKIQIASFFFPVEGLLLPSTPAPIFQMMENFYNSVMWPSLRHKLFQSLTITGEEKRLPPGSAPTQYPASTFCCLPWGLRGLRGGHESTVTIGTRPTHGDPEGHSGPRGSHTLFRSRWLFKVERHFWALQIGKYLSCETSSDSCNRTQLLFQNLSQNALHKSCVCGESASGVS